MLFRTLAACLLVVQCTGAPRIGTPAIPSPIDDLIIALLEAFRDSLTEPQPLQDIAIDINQPGIITMRLNVTDGLLHDLSTFVIDNVHVDPLTLKADIALSLPTLSLEANYAFGSGSAIADLFPFYGSGPASGAVGGVVLTADADLKHNFTGGHDHYQIDALDFLFHFDTLDVQIHNLFDNEDLATVIDGFADDLGPVLVDVLVEETRKDLMPLIIDVLNDILWNATIVKPEPDAASEPLKAVPVKLPIADGPVPSRQPALHQHIAHGIHLDKAGTSDFNAKRRRGNRS